MITRYDPKEISVIWEDKNRFKYWKDVEIAVCRAHTKLGNIPEDAMKVIEEKADFNAERVLEIEAEVNHDVIAFLTNMAEYIGPESRYVHLGMTSSDLLDTTLALQCKEAGGLIAELLDEVLEVVKSQSIKYKDLLMLGRSHGVAAEPTTFGLKLGLWYTELQRSKTRLLTAIESVSVGQVSGAVGNFAHLSPEIEEMVCAELDLKPALITSQIIQRDRHAEFLNAIAVMGASLEKFATEIRNLHRDEIKEVEEPFGKKQKGSSAMPHKKNPIICERITGMARLLRTNALASVENICLWHERDISHSSVERVILPDSTALIFYMLTKFKAIVKDMRVFPENMKRNLDATNDLVFSQGILLALAMKGLTREESYSLVQNAAMQAREGNGTFKENVLENDLVKAKLSQEEMDECFNIEKFRRKADYVLKRAGII